MAERFADVSEQKFRTPEEELSFLREQVKRHEAALAERGETARREEVVSREIRKHAERDADDMLAKEYVLKHPEREAIVLDLAPEAHDQKMAELITVLQEKGVLNTLSVVEGLRDPHVADDFERFLVQYVKAGFATGKNERGPIWKALAMTLFEVSLPAAGKDEDKKTKGLKELVSKMEQFYAGMLSVERDDANGPGYFSIELASAKGSNETVLYMAVPDGKRTLFEKQLQSVFPDAVIAEKKDDYNIFNESGDYVGSYAALAANAVLPIRTYEEYDHDPLAVLVESFSKIAKVGEGASVEIVVKPAPREMMGFFQRVLKGLEKGMPFKAALDEADISFLNMFKHAGAQLVGMEKQKKDGTSAAPNATKVEAVRKKTANPLLSVNIRIMASAASRERAGAILADIESSFNQFENTSGNRFVFDRVEGKRLLEMARDFSFRLFDDRRALTLSTKELTTVMHLPEGTASRSSELRQTNAVSAPAPLDLPMDGILLGENVYRNVRTPVHISAEDRLRHVYLIGQTGTGKTTMLKSMIRQDILAGDGVCMLDPHGSDIQEVLSYIPPERYGDVIYFDPSHTERPMGLNMLEYDRRFPEQKTFVVNEMLSIFNKLFDMKTAGGPMFEQYFRNAVMLTIEDPESGSTLLDVSRVLSDKAYRELKLAKCKNPIVIQFWREIAAKAGGEASLANIVPYITSKFDVFLSNDIMRPIVSQEKSAFDFRDVMDNKKILLVNLAKGRLGDINSNLIGLIIVGKILMAALSRVDSLGADLPPFYLYIDEFQNVTTDSIAVILSEARKYKLSLTVAHQFIKQLDEKIKDAVFGNVGTMDVFRVSSDDAEYLAKQFAPVFSANDLMNIEMHHSYIKLLSRGKPTKPFSLLTNLPPRGDKLFIDKIKELSYQKYGADRQEVERAILEKYKKPDIKV